MRLSVLTIEGLIIVAANLPQAGTLKMLACSLTLSSPQSSPTAAQSMSQGIPLSDSPPIRSTITRSTPPSTGKNLPSCRTFIWKKKYAVINVLSASPHHRGAGNPYIGLPCGSAVMRIDGRGQRRTPCQDVLSDEQSGAVHPHHPD